MSKRAAPSLTLPSLLSDLSLLSQSPTLLPALPPAALAPSSPDLTSPLSVASSSPSALAVQVAEEFLKSSNTLLDKVELEVVEGLRARIDGVEAGVREVQRGFDHEQEHEGEGA